MLVKAIESFLKNIKMVGMISVLIAKKLVKDITVMLDRIMQINKIQTARI